MTTATDYVSAPGVVDCVKTEDSLPGERYTLVFPEKPTTNEVFFVAEYFSTRAELCRVEIFGEVKTNEISSILWLKHLPLMMRYSM